jgi:hypothetical protein
MAHVISAEKEVTWQINALIVIMTVLARNVPQKILNCNKKGHLAKDCWFQELNKDKRPPGFVVKSSKEDSGEKAAAGIDNMKTLEEYLLGTLDSSDMINNQELWIADSAATVHMTPYQNGLENIKKIKEAYQSEMEPKSK